MEILQTINANVNERSYTFPIYHGKENLPFASSSNVKLDQLEGSYNAKRSLWNDTSLPVPLSNQKASAFTNSPFIDSEALFDGISDAVPISETIESKDLSTFYDAEEDEEMNFASETQKLSLQIFEEHLSQFSHSNALEESDLVGILPDEPLPLPPCGQQITPPASKIKKAPTKRKSRAKPPVQAQNSKAVEQSIETETIKVIKSSTRPKPRRATNKKVETNADVEIESELKPPKPKRTRKSGKKAKEEFNLEPNVHLDVPKFLFTDAMNEQIQGLNDDDDYFFFHKAPIAPEVELRAEEMEEGNLMPKLEVQDKKRPHSSLSEGTTSNDSLPERLVESKSIYFDPTLINPAEKAKVQKSLLYLNNCPLCREFWPTLIEDKDGKIVNKSKRVCKTVTGPRRISHLHLCARKYKQTYEEVVSLLRRDKISLDRNKRLERIKEMQEESVWQDVCGSSMPSTQLQTSVRKMHKSKRNWYRINKFVQEKAREQQELQAKKKTKRVRSGANGGIDRETTIIEMPTKDCRKDVEKCYSLFGLSIGFNNDFCKGAKTAMDDDVICTSDEFASLYDDSDQACEMPFESICRARKRRRGMREGYSEIFNTNKSSLCTMGLLFGQRLAKAFNSKASRNEEV